MHLYVCYVLKTDYYKQYARCLLHQLHTVADDLLMKFLVNHVYLLYNELHFIM